MTTAEVERAAVDAFIVYAAQLGEQCWCAGWVVEWEHMLWEELEHPNPETTIGYFVGERERATLRWLSACMSGWAAPAHDGTANGYVLWGFDEWAVRHAAWQRVCQERRAAYPPRAGEVIP